MKHSLVHQHDARIENHLPFQLVESPLIKARRDMTYIGYEGYGTAQIKPVKKPVRVDTMTPFLGVELELEVSPTSKYVKDLQKVHGLNKKTLFAQNEYKTTTVTNFASDSLQQFLDGMSFIKRDGSLKCGIEVVSLPMHVEVHATYWDKFFSNLRKFGLAVRSTCGMHVHASRCDLSALQIGKVMAFIYNESNTAFIELVAGRKPPKKYANIYLKKKISDCGLAVAPPVIEGMKLTSPIKANSPRPKRVFDHHDALNLKNVNTIEFRIFKATANKERFLSNIEFCAALLSFYWPGRSSINTGLEDFLRFMENPVNGREFPHFREFLRQNKLIRCKKKKVKPSLRDKENSRKKGAKNENPE